MIMSPNQDHYAGPSSEPDEMKSENLEDQNIFQLLGLTFFDPNEKESFLNDLQERIWDDFIESDTRLLLTEAERAHLMRLLTPDPRGLEAQEDAVIYLENLVPDLGEIMTEKALILKGELARARMEDLLLLYNDNSAMRAKLDAIGVFMDEERWGSASAALEEALK